MQSDGKLLEAFQSINDTELESFIENIGLA
jgi:hypothetical protein